MPISLWRWAPGAWSSNPGWPDPTCMPSHHVLKEQGEIWIFFLLWKQLLLLAGMSQPHAPQSLAGEELGVTTWQRFFIRKQHSPASCLNSVCTPNWTEANCPICWQNHPPWLQRTPTLEGEPPGVQREMEIEALAGHTASACHPSWLLFESKALHHPTPSLRRPNIPKAQILFEVDVLLFTRWAAEGPGLEEGSPRGRPPRPPPVARFQPLPGW